MILQFHSFAWFNGSHNSENGMVILKTTLLHSSNQTSSYSYCYGSSPLQLEDAHSVRVLFDR